MTMSTQHQPRLRVLVVEDERPARDYLVELLCNADMADPVVSASTVSEARQAVGPGGVVVDAAFLDINLATSGGEAAGMALIREIAGSPNAPKIVLTTAIKRHAIEAFELGVFDYLLKPFTEERVYRCLERLRAALPQPSTPKAQNRVAARKKGGLVFLKLDDVWAFEASDRLTFVHTAHGTFDVDLSLAALESSFGAAFVRVHRNWLVHTSHIAAMEREDGDTILLVGDAPNCTESGLRVPVARDRAADVRRDLLNGSLGIRK